MKTETLNNWINREVEVKIVNKSKNLLPEYASKGAAGMDLRADLESPITLKPMERKMIPTGIFIQLPEGYEAQVRPRSGLAIKHGISVINTPGTIDEDYTGEVKVLLVNLSNEDFVVENKERIAQMIINKYDRCKWNQVEELTKTERGEGGFGHTGIK